MPRCKACRKKFEAKYFLQKACLNPKCLAEWAKQDREIKAEAKHKQDKKRLKDNDRSFRDKQAQAAFNKYIRERDSDLPCVSCGRAHSGQYHAGHYLSRGAHPELRFEEDNCHKQCAPCNNHLSGNISNYRPALVKKIGQDRVDWLEGKHEVRKYTCEDLKEVELKYKQKLKELNK